jgi:hypothetical protein
MSESENPLGLCPACLEKVRPVLQEIREISAKLKKVLHEDLRKFEGGPAEW